MWEDAIEAIMTGDILTGIFQLLMSLVLTIVSIILYPFGLLIKQFLPDVDSALSALSEYFVYVAQYMGWILDALLVPKIVITMIVTYYLFRFSVTFGAWGIKLVLKWKKAIWA